MTDAPKPPRKPRAPRATKPAAPDELRLEYMPLATLKRFPGNPKAHDDAAIKGSVERFGFRDPIAIDEKSGCLSEGHGRLDTLQAMRAAGSQPPEYIQLAPDGSDWLVPVVRGGSFRSKAEMERYVVAHNQTTIAGGWGDGRLLAGILQRAQESSVPPEVMGFTGAQAQEILAKEHARAVGAGEEAGPPDPGPQIDRAAELAAKWGTASGQLWEIPSASVKGKAHRLLCGDSTKAEDVARVMGGEKARWCWSDPPYGVDYIGGTGMTIQNDGERGLPELLRLAFLCVDDALDDGAPIYIAHPSRGELPVVFGNAFVAARWHLHQTIVWVKDQFVLGRCDYHFRHELLMYGWKTGAEHSWFGGRDKDSVMEIPRPSRSEEHPTMKPPALVAACLLNSAPPGSRGIEPFNGSGTTMVAAEQSGMVCSSVEMAPRYVAVALERLSGLGLTPRLLPG